MRPLDYLDATAREHPDRPLLVTDSQSWSYEEVATRSRQIAWRLAQLGFRPGDHGAVLAPNDPAGFICTLGLLRAGLVWVPTNPRNGIPENSRILAKLDCDVLFVHSGFADALPELRAGNTRLREVVTYDEDLDSWLGDAVGEADVHPAEDDVAMIAPTSGTTGEPKGVMLTNGNVVAFTDAFLELYGDAAAPVYLVAAPMTHVAGRTCFPIMAAGGTVVVIERAEPRAVLDAIARHRVTDVFLPPTAIYSLLDEPTLTETDLSSLRHLSYGSAPMRLDRLRQALRVFGPRLVQGYGQTEAPMMIAHMRPEDHFVDGEIAPDQRLSSCGRPTNAVEVAILADDGRPLPAGERGEVCVRGGIVMKGYYKDQDATAEAFRHDWLHTGDIGYLDDEGFLHLVDRAKDMIVSGGFNVYPAEVERVLAQRPEVGEAVVIGVPDDRWGESVKAIVTLRAKAQVSDVELIDYCKSRLGSVKAPKTIEFWEEIPRSPVGKVLKRKIREQYWAGAERRV